MVKDAPAGFGPALLSGLAELGAVEPFSGDLSLELGISVWLRTSGTSLVEARSALLEIRQVILEVCELDPSTEPFPLVGRSPRSDVLSLVGYISELLRRASAGLGRAMEAVVQAVVAELPVLEDEALGA
ncbi:MAG TPA: hypothetical protein VHX67_05965 [Acidimicrobiales bacterium]|jgi:hypothetical protein|nr:hypothetical protein [Acidimicrobiales bacterium]